MADYSDRSTPARTGRGTESLGRKKRLSLDRRLFVKGMVSAMPAVLTVRSGAALAVSTMMECANDAQTVDSDAVRVASNANNPSEPTDVGTYPVTSRYYTREVFIDDGGTLDDTADDVYRTDVVWIYQDLDDSKWYVAKSYSLIDNVETMPDPSLPIAGTLVQDPGFLFMGWTPSATFFRATNPQAWAVVYVNNTGSGDELRVDEITISSGYPLNDLQTPLQVSAACLASMAALGIGLDD